MDVLMRATSVMAETQSQTETCETLSQTSQMLPYAQDTERYDPFHCVCCSYCSSLWYHEEANIIILSFAL